MLKKIAPFFLFSILLLALIGLAKLALQSNLSDQEGIIKFEEVLLEKQKAIKLRLDELVTIDRQGALSEHAEGFFNLKKSDQFSFYIYHNDELFYWSDNGVEVVDKQLNPGLNRLGNGYYWLEELIVDQSKYLGLIQLREEYWHENKYLKNRFTSEFRNSGFSGISSNPLENAQSIKIDNKQEFYLIPQNQINVFGENSTLAYAFFLLLLLATYGLIPYLVFQKRKSALLQLGLIAIFFLIYSFFSDSENIDHSFFQEQGISFFSFLTTPAHLLMLSLSGFLLFLSLKKFEYRSPISKNLISYFQLYFSFFLSLGLIQLIEKVVQLGKTPLHFQDLFSLNLNSYAYWFAFALLMLTAINILDSGAKQAQKKKPLAKVLITLVYLIMASYFYFTFGSDLLSLWLFPILLLYFFIEKFQIKAWSLMLLLSYLAAIQAMDIESALQEKEERVRVEKIKLLSEEKDLLTEHLFSEIQENIYKDSLNFSLLKRHDPINSEEYNDYLLETYFGDYLSRYDTRITVCRQNDSLIIDGQGQRVACVDYFFEKIKYEGDVISSTNLFQLQNLAGRIDYLAQLEFDIDSQLVSVFVEMSSNSFNQNEGYPELLIAENSLEGSIDLNNYSYAVYNKKNLVFRSGSFNYSTYPRIGELDEQSLYRYEYSGFDHLAYKKDRETIIVLSKKLYGFSDFLSALTYLLLFLTAIQLLFSFISPNLSFRILIDLQDFSARFQLFLVGSLMTALILFGLASVYYIQKQYQEKNFKQLSEKIRSVNIELEGKIGGLSTIDSTDVDYVSNYLVKFSNVFYSDINLYDKTGKLIASSRKEMYDKQLKSQQIHPLAFKGLVNDQKAEWIQEEHIGALGFISAYIPFRNIDNKVIAYLNLPYFAKQGELENEISSFMVSTITIYLGIFILSLFLAVILINQLSRPLVLIRKQISKVRLGSEIHLINWKGKDEIGTLVQEYNRMLIELAESAERLAQSEREGAWREMAKQVAHEIKNPLTPMKLSIQYLQKASEQGAEDIKERILSTSETLVEQIDSLSNIANEFSNFAKMPAKKYQEIDLIPLVQLAIDLFKNTENIVIKLETKLEEAFVYADKDQILRILNNLTKNSIQARDDDKALKILFTLSEHEGQWCLLIEDNGIGVPVDMRNNIFEPNFTTKSSGTGLGLAISKSIMEEMNGSIAILPSEKGATFELIFKKYLKT